MSSQKTTKNKYEFVFILPVGDKSQEKKAITEIENQFAKLNLKVGKKQSWGEKEFAYPIGSQLRGHYHFWNISAESPISKKTIATYLNRHRGILRYLLVKS